MGQLEHRNCPDHWAGYHHRVKPGSGYITAEKDGAYMSETGPYDSSPVQREVVLMSQG